MKKLFTTRYNAGAFNTALLVLRLALGLLMAGHGYQKLLGYSEMKSGFMSFLGISPSITLAMVIFAELFCSIFIVLGLFTRLACIPLIILTCVIIFQVGTADFFGKQELPTLYLAGFIALLLTGAGKISVDHLIGK